MFHKPIIKSDKLGRICSIYWNDSDSTVTPDEFKDALNYFRGQQIKSSLKNCLNYIRLSLSAQTGNVEAIRTIEQLHYSWNHEKG